MIPSRIITVDWSGAERGHERRLWTADVRDGVLTRLVNGRTREAVTAELLAITRDARATGERVVVGLDFAFGAPAWYLDACGWPSATAMWRALTPAAVAALLAAPRAPFWGREPTPRRPAELREDGTMPPWRDTERSLQEVARPFSVFQLVGAGAVGVGSLRGAATLAALHEAGAVIWPFDDDTGGPGVVVAEVWPRLAIRTITKSDAAARRAALTELARAVGGTSPTTRPAADSDDAFDALAAAAWLWMHRRHLDPLPADSTPAERREGRILGARTSALLDTAWRAAARPRPR